MRFLACLILLAGGTYAASAGVYPVWAWLALVEVAGVMAAVRRCLQVCADLFNS